MPRFPNLKQTHSFLVLIPSACESLVQLYMVGTNWKAVTPVLYYPNNHFLHQQEFMTIHAHSLFFVCCKEEIGTYTQPLLLREH